MSSRWVDKYRPKKLEDVIGQDIIINQIREFMKKGSYPHMMFIGRAGTGKSSTAECFANELLKDTKSMNLMELNASDERGIDVVRNKIKNFCKTIPFESEYKVLVLEEADALSNDAQQALRRIMEIYGKHTIFIFSINYESKMIEPIKSRCSIFRFRSLKDEDVKKVLERILNTENVSYTTDVLDKVIELSKGDLRKATNMIEKYSIDGHLQITDITENFDKLLNASKTKNPVLILKNLNDFLQIYEARELLSLLFDYMMENNLCNNNICNHFAEYDFRLSVGAFPNIQLVNFLMSLGELIV